MVLTRTIFERQVSWYGCRERSSRSDSHSHIIFIWAVYHICTSRQQETYSKKPTKDRSSS